MSMDKILVCTTPNSYRSYGEYWNNSGINFTYLNDVTKENKI